MIRNIDDEKKFIRQRHNGDFSGYLSEKELEELMEQVESHEMLRAPAHLKSNVVTQIRRERRDAKRKQVFAYRAKVFVAMAAALTVLILIPDDHTESVSKIFIEQQADESLEQMALQRQEDMAANWEKYLKERENGGVRSFFTGINERITEFGTGLYDSIGGV